MNPRTSFSMIKLVTLKRLMGSLTYKIWNVIYHINKLKEKKHIFISLNIEETFYKFACQFMKKTLERSGIKEIILQHNEGDI